MEALAAALDPQGPGAPVAWNSPYSKNKGIFAAQGKPYPMDDQVCRSFYATIIKKDATEQLSGTACLHKSGDWAIAELKSGKKSATP